MLWAGVDAGASSGGAGAPYRGAAPCVGGEGGTPGNGAGAGEDDESRGGSGALGGGGGGTPGTPAAVEAALIPLRPLASAYTAYKEGLGEARAALETAGAAYGEAEAAYRSALPATKASSLNVAVSKLGEDAAARRATVGHLARNDAPRKALAEVLHQAADVLQLAESRHREASGAEAALRRALENTGATPALLRRLLPAAALDGWISTPEGEEGIPPPPDPPAPPPPGGAIVPRDLDGSFSAEQMRTELKSIAESAATAAAQSVLERFAADVASRQALSPAKPSVSWDPALGTAGAGAPAAGGAGGDTGADALAAAQRALGNLHPLGVRPGLQVAAATAQPAAPAGTAAHDEFNPASVSDLLAHLGSDLTGAERAPGGAAGGGTVHAATVAGGGGAGGVPALPPPGIAASRAVVALSGLGDPPAPAATAGGESSVFADAIAQARALQSGRNGESAARARELRLQAFEALVGASPITPGGERKARIDVMRVMLRVAPARTQSADPIENLRELCMEEDALLGDLPKGMRTWQALRAALRSYCQALSLASARATASESMRALQAESHLIVRLWTELEAVTEKGKLYPKLVEGMETELDALSRSEAPFGISAMLSAPAAAASGAVAASAPGGHGSSADAANKALVAAARQVAEAGASMARQTKAAMEQMTSLAKQAKDTAAHKRGAEGQGGASGGPKKKQRGGDGAGGDH